LALALTKYLSSFLNTHVCLCACAAINDPATEAKGYWGFAVHTSSAHGDRVRVLYASTRKERDEWLSVLRRACRSVPFDEEYDLGECVDACVSIIMLRILSRLSVHLI
jgi:hypothetical protein